MWYFDTSYLVRLYLEDPGWKAVRQLAAMGDLGCCVHGRAEVIAAFHRKFREGLWNAIQLRDVLEQFERDCDGDVYRWLPLSGSVVMRLARTYEALPKTVVLRAADALHLACAAENHFPAIHSNDLRLLAAAPRFGIKGVNVI